MMPESICHYFANICQWRKKNSNSTWIVINEAIFIFSLCVCDCFIFLCLCSSLESISNAYIRKKFIKFKRCTCVQFILMHFVVGFYFFSLSPHLQCGRRISRSTNMSVTSEATNVEHLYKSTSHS